jgi:phosphoribosylformimino-5-aminoimidazole carboxamide ribotide isomerase
VILYPAIDIRGGRAVRLLRGDYAQEIAYDTDPLDAARRWVAQGARFLHVVDLDGARSGHPENLRHVERIAGELGVQIQLGGGLRDPDSVEAAFAAGADRVVLGTAALRDPVLVDELVELHGDRVVVSVDARSGEVAAEGWERGTGVGVEDLLQELATHGVERFVFTPIEVDGTMTGPLPERLRSAAEVAAGCGTELIYSGGVGSLEDLRGLTELRLASLGGVIVGRALYEGRFTVGEGQAALDGG